MKEFGPLNYFLGIEVLQTNTILFLNQIKYALDYLKRAKMANCKPIATPMVVGQHMSNVVLPFQIPHTIDPSLVVSNTWSLLMAHVVNIVCQFMHVAIEDNFCTIKPILRYVKGTLSHGLNLSSQSSSNILAYSDASWAGFPCTGTQHSIFGYVVFLDNNLISWSAKNQSIISHSCAESKYCSLALIVAKVTLLTHLLRDLHISSYTPATIICDNCSANLMSANLVSHAHSKHIALDYHFVRNRLLCVLYALNLFLSICSFTITDC
jgi:hypothetical protein